MRSAFQMRLLQGTLCIALVGCLAFLARVATAGTPATTAIHTSSDSGIAATPVRGYRPYRGFYRPYYRRPYRPYVYRPYVYGAYPYPAYGYGYPYSIRSPYYFGYRYPGARARGYNAYPRPYVRPGL